MVEEEVSVEAVQWEEVEEVPPWAEVEAGALLAGVEGDSSIIADHCYNERCHITIGLAQHEE